MSLCVEFIKGLFDRLTLRYGSAFMDRWAGLPLAAVKDDWAREQPEVIKHALALLDPVEPPTAVQFRTLCLTMPAPARRLQLPPKLAHRAAEVRRRVLRPVLQHPGRDLRWATEMVRRADAGEHVHSYNLGLARAALAQPRST
jgi:hypothetical protein